MGVPWVITGEKHGMMIDFSPGDHDENFRHVALVIASRWNVALFNSAVMDIRVCDPAPHSVKKWKLLSALQNESVFYNILRIPLAGQT